MTNAYSYNEKDIGVLFVPPLSPVDVRVPTAEEMTLNTLIRVKKEALPVEWLNTPSLTNNEDLLTLKGTFVSPYSRKEINLNFSFTLPQLLYGETFREEQLNLVSLLVEEGEIHDPVLGTVSFQYDTPTGELVTSPTRENTRRLREKFLLCIRLLSLSDDFFLNGTDTDPDGSMFIEVSPSGSSAYLFAPNTYIYDPFSDWLSATRYKLPLLEEGIFHIPLCHISRWQNISVNGYKWTEEPTFDSSLSVGLSHIKESSNIKALAYRLMRGLPLKHQSYSYDVVNFSSGNAPIEYLHPGYSLVSPNGSISLSNNERISFTNQRFLQNNAVSRVTATVDNNTTFLSANLSSSSPPDSIFSELSTDHKIYSLDGLEQSERGRFLGLGSNNTLLWYGGNRSTISADDVVYFVPSVYYSAGSGFSKPLLELNNVYVNGAEIDPRNIRLGYKDDLGSYEDPEGDLPYFVVYGPERNAIHYILKKITINTDDRGILLLPETEKGNIAYVKGKEARYDRPVVTGLTPSSSYDCLIYYPPRNNELWQFHYKTIEYQGKNVSDIEFLKGEMEIEQEPFLFVHGNGGGNGIFKGDPWLNYLAISNFLPRLQGDVPLYSLSGPIFYKGDTLSTASLSNMRELILTPCSSYVLPRKNLKIRFTSFLQPIQNYSLLGTLVTADDKKQLGFLPPPHEIASPYYQYCLFLLVRQGDTRRMIVCTSITDSQKEIGLSSNLSVAIDVFEV